MTKQLKIAFTGPESSGKSTIAKLIAETCNGIYVEEYAREYLLSKNSYEQIDLDEIARVQYKKWLVNGTLLVADTEMTVLKIWSEYRFKSCSKGIKKAYQNQEFDHYFLCKPDIPWEYDPLRENPTNRDELFELYHRELIRMNRSFTILNGDLKTRLVVCKNLIESMSVHSNS